MSSLFECSEFEPPLYFKGSNARLDKELNTKHVQYSNGKSFYDCQFVHFLMQKHPKNCSFSTDRFCCREASEIQFFFMILDANNIQKPKYGLYGIQMVLLFEYPLLGSPLYL